MLDMFWRLAPLVAQAAGGGGGGGGGLGGPEGLLSSPLLLVGAIALVFYFMLIRPEGQKKKERERMLNNLQKGDEVMTAGGLYGKITATTDQSVTVEIAPNVRVKISRQYVSGLTSQVEGDKAKDKDKADTGNGKK